MIEKILEIMMLIALGSLTITSVASIFLLAKAIQDENNLRWKKKMINRQKLIEAVEKEYYKFIDDDGDVAHNRAIYDVIEIINSQPPADQWIPCSERLPDESGEYWVTFLWGGKPMAQVGYYYADDKTWSRDSYDPIAWKPYILPEPYKGVE